MEKRLRAFEGSPYEATVAVLTATIAKLRALEPPKRSGPPKPGEPAPKPKKEPGDESFPPEAPQWGDIPEGVIQAYVARAGHALERERILAAMRLGVRPRDRALEAELRRVPSR